MITGILLIGLGITLVYREIKKKTGAEQSTRLPVMVEAVGRAVGTQIGTMNTMNHNMDTILEKLTALERLDNILEKLTALQRNLIDSETRVDILEKTCEIKCGYSP